ncbi:MAG: hypothetical protein QM760_12575 [Nibricoccus sp.]
MKIADPVTKLEELLVARGMQRKDVPGFIARYAKKPALRAALELQRRGIRHDTAFQAINELQAEETARASILPDSLNPSAGISAILGIASLCGGLRFLESWLHKTSGPWPGVILLSLGLIFISAP